MNDFEDLKDFKKLPTLYDFFLAQEKIGYEIKRQNKELNILNSSVENLYCLLEEEKNKYREPDIEKKIDLDLDYIFDLINSFKLAFSSFDQLKSRLLESYSKNPWFFKKKKNPKTIDQMLSSFEEGLGFLYKKLILQLANHEISVIEPKVGDSFSPLFHKAIETIALGKEEKIDKVISYGFIKKNKVLAFANVIVK